MTSQTLVLLAALLAAPACAAREEPRLVPRPASIAMGQGEYVLPDRLEVAHGPGAHPGRFADRLRNACGITLVPVGDRQGTITFSLRDTTVQHPAESYRIEVTADGIQALANDDAGFTHAGSTLIQALCGARALPLMTIEDAPALRWRGVMLDSARHFQSPEYIERFLEAMALHKLNVLHWHLTDDQAWRLEIRKYPKLTEVGAWRAPAGAGRGTRYGGFYSQATVRRIVARAAELGITVMPEIEMPGHASAALAAYPALGAKKDAVSAVPADWGVYPNAFSLEESTFAFLEDVLRETMELFPSKYIHVGGDEVEPGQWLAAGEQGTGAEIQARFTERMARFLESEGRVLVGWDEILSPGLAKQAVVMSWRGIDGALKAAAQGHDTILAAWPTLYFDNRQAATPDGPPGRLRVVSLQDVYGFDPVPDSLAPDQARHVLGLQAQVWTEHIRTEERVDHMTFPRLAAVAELGWTPAARRQYADFTRRLPVLSAIYDTLGIRASRGHETPRVSATRRGFVRIPPPADRREEVPSRELRLCGDAIPLALEDDAPLDGERAVFAVDIQNPCWHLSGLTDARSLQVQVGQVPFNFQIGEARDKIRFAAPETAAGELLVHRGSCNGDLLARLPLAEAAKNDGVTRLPRFELEDDPEDLCLQFAQPALEPLWVIDRLWVERARP